MGRPRLCDGHISREIDLSGNILTFALCNYLGIQLLGPLKTTVSGRSETCMLSTLQDLQPLAISTAILIAPLLNSDLTGDDVQIKPYVSGQASDQFHLQCHSHCEQPTVHVRRTECTKRHQSDPSISSTAVNVDNWSPRMLVANGVLSDRPR